MSARSWPKVANNCSTLNDCFGAKAALQFQFSYYRFVPETDAQPVVIFHAKPDTDTHREKI
jgi:hypothetical protein